MKRYIKATTVKSQPAVSFKNEQQRAGYEAANRLMKKYPKAMKVLAQ